MPYRGTPYFHIPCTARSSRTSEPKPIPQEDIKAIEMFPDATKAISDVFGEDATSRFLQSDGAYAYVDLAGKRPLLADGVDVPAMMQLTAKELEENASKERPLRIVEAVTHRSFVQLLKAFSSKNPKPHLAPTYTDDTGTYPVPVLPPQMFSEPKKQQTRSRTSTFLVTGAYFHPQKGYIAKITAEFLDVRLTEDLLPEVVKHPLSFFAHESLWFEGTIVPDGPSMWSTIPGGRITHQANLVT